MAFLSKQNFERVVSIHFPLEAGELLKNIREEVKEVCLFPVQNGSEATKRAVSKQRTSSPLSDLFPNNERDSEETSLWCVHTLKEYWQQCVIGLQNRTEEWVLFPHSSGTCAWSLVMCLFTMYNLIFLFLRVALLCGSGPSVNTAFSSSTTTFWILDCIGDLCYIMDMVIRSYFLAYLDNGVVVTEKTLIAQKYRSSMCFWFHALSVIPVDLLYWSVVVWSARALPGLTHTSWSLAQLIALCRSNKLFRLVDVQDMLKLVERGIARSNYRMNRNAINLLKVIGIIYLIAHCIGCLFIVIAVQMHVAGDQANWADANSALPVCTADVDSLGNDIYDCTFSSLSWPVGAALYIKATYWAIATISTVGYGDIVAVGTSEKLFNILVFLLCTVIYSLVVANLQDIVSRIDVTSDIYIERSSEVTGFLFRQEHLTASFRNRVSVYFEKLWLLSKGVAGGELKGYIPLQFYSTSIHTLLKPHLDKLFFFKSFAACAGECRCDESQSGQGDAHHTRIDFLYDVSSKFTMHTYVQNDVMFHSHAASESLYILCSGEVKLLSEDTSSLPHLSGSSTAPSRKKSADVKQYTVVDKACPIGEYEFFTRSLYACAAVCSSDVVHMLEISYTDFWDVVCKHKLQEQYAHEHSRNKVHLLNHSSTAIVYRLQSNMRNSKMIKMMTNAAPSASTRPSWIVLPGSAIAIAWTVLSLVCVVYVALSVPYQIALLQPITSSALSAYGNEAYSSQRLNLLFLDCFWIVFAAVDVFLRCCCFAIKENGILIDKQDAFLELYMNQWIIYDVIAAFPTAIVVMAVNSAGHSDVARWSQLSLWFRCLYLLKIGRIEEHFDLLLHAVQSHLSAADGIHSNILRLIKAVCIVWYFGHVACCVFCYIGVFHLRNDAGVSDISSMPSSVSWIVANELVNESPIQIYLMGFLWTMYSLSTVGYGTIQVVTDNERVFAILVMVCGVVLCDAGVAAILNALISGKDKLGSHSRCVHNHCFLATAAVHT